MFHNNLLQSIKDIKQVRIKKIVKKSEKNLKSELNNQSKISHFQVGSFSLNKYVIS